MEEGLTQRRKGGKVFEKGSWYESVSTASGAGRLLPPAAFPDGMGSCQHVPLANHERPALSPQRAENMSQAAARPKVENRRDRHERNSSLRRRSRELEQPEADSGLLDADFAGGLGEAEGDEGFAG